MAILKPFDEPTAAGAMPFAIVGGQAVPFGSAVTRLRDEAPALAGLFDANGKLDLAKLSHDQYLAIRNTTRESCSAWDRSGNAFLPRPAPVRGSGWARGTGQLTFLTPLSNAE